MKVKEIPYLSDNIATMILDTFESSANIVEYGSGNSTLFFIDYLIKNKIKCNFISVESSPEWFYRIIDLLTRYKISKKEYIVMPWSLGKILRYLFSRNKSTLKVPFALRRLPRAKSLLMLNLIKFRSSYSNCTFRCLIEDKINFTYFLKTDLIKKDQYGESPFKKEYIEAGIPNVKGNTAYIIDGGPRGDIVTRILNSKEKHYMIFLLESHRLFYKEILSRYPEGRFIAGSNRMLNGELTYKPNKNLTKKGKLKHRYWYGTKLLTAEQELWFYKVT